MTAIQTPLFNAKRVSITDHITGYYWYDELCEIHYIQLANSIQTSHAIDVSTLKMSMTGSAPWYASDQVSTALTLYESEVNQSLEAQILRYCKRWGLTNSFSSILEEYKSYMGGYRISNSGESVVKEFERELEAYVLQNNL